MYLDIVLPTIILKRYTVKEKNSQLRFTKHFKIQQFSVFKLFKYILLKE